MREADDWPNIRGCRAETPTTSFQPKRPLTKITAVDSTARRVLDGRPAHIDAWADFQPRPATRICAELS